MTTLKEKVVTYQARVESVDLGDYYTKAKAKREMILRLLAVLGCVCIPALLVVLC